MLGALIKKDLRACRLPLLVGLFLLFAPFGLAAVAVINMPLWNEATSATGWAVLLGTGSYFSVMTSQATLAMLSGNLIAFERGDRSAEFLAYLPPSRKQILGSKAVVLFGFALILLSFNALINGLAHALAGDTDAVRTVTANLVSRERLIMIGIAAIGAGWFASALAQNSGPAVAIAFAGPLLVQTILISLYYATGWPSELDYARTYFGGCVLFGTFFFVLGTFTYLHRSEG